MIITVTLEKILANFFPALVNSLSIILIGVLFVILCCLDPWQQIHLLRQMLRTQVWDHHKSMFTFIFNSRMVGKDDHCEGIERVQIQQNSQRPKERIML